MSNSAELIFDARNATGESPVWLASEQALYWTDIPARKLWRWRAEDAQCQSWDAPEMIACMAATSQSGRWVAGMETGVFALTLQAGQTMHAELLAPVSHARAGMRFNDGRCDRQGRFVAGTMLMNMAACADMGCIYSYEKNSNDSPIADTVTDANPGYPPGALRGLLQGFITPNGMAFSPDGKTMYLSDSHPSVQMIWAFDYDTETGTPSNQRVFVDMNPLSGRPDGAAVDADGCYWICGNDAGLIHRFTPEGKLDRSLAVPVKKPAMCAFGGAGLDTLFVTSIRPDGIDLSDQPLAGGLFALRPGVCGLPEAACVI